MFPPDLDRWISRLGRGHPFLAEEEEKQWDEIKRSPIRTKSCFLEGFEKAAMPLPWQG